MTREQIGNRPPCTTRHRREKGCPSDAHAMGRIASAEVTEGGPGLFRRPYAEGAPDEYQLTYVVGVVVGDEQQLAQIRLPRAVRNPRE